MIERIFGTECEYAPTYQSKDNTKIAWMSEEELLDHLKGLSVMLFSSLKRKKYPMAGEFLGNGGRLYIDRGGHPEYATPECRSIKDLIAYEKAGDRLVQELAALARPLDDHPHTIPELHIFKNNVDSYGNTYGGHENYLISPKAAENIHQIIPFLVTRQIFTGTGRVSTHQDTGDIFFKISQRADFIRRKYSDRTTNVRGIINTRRREIYNNEQNRRLHIIVGDSNMSEAAVGLKIGTTVLILRLLEEGKLNDIPALSSPVTALKSISRSWNDSFPLEDRKGRLTALDVQSIYLDHVRRFFSSHSPTSEEASILALWEEILAGLNQLKISKENFILEEDPHKLRRKIDWILKLWLLNRYGKMDDTVVNNRSLKLLDVKYHDLNPTTGLYSQCDSLGLVDHMVEEDAVLRAKRLPPDNTRARIRGKVIRQTAEMNVEVNIEDWENINIKPKGRDTGSAHFFNQHRGIGHHLKIRLDDPFKAVDPSIFEQLEHFMEEWR
jgi:proteasome accessory factor A